MAVDSTVTQSVVSVGEGWRCRAVDGPWIMSPFAALFVLDFVGERFPIVRTMMQRRSVFMTADRSASASLVKRNPGVSGRRRPLHEWTHMAREIADA